MEEAGILIADDEERIRKLVADFLKKEGYFVFEAGDGEEAVSVFQTQEEKISLLILDVLMPKLDGWEVLAAVRDSSSVPVIMLTAKSSEQDQLGGFIGGADDYITKPFSPVLLVARVRALLKRAAPKSGIKVCGAVRIDSPSHTAFLYDTALDLTPKEYDLLCCLVENKGIVLSRESILNKVWKFDYEGDLRTVDTHIKQLRSKLGEQGCLIATVRGIGYLMEVRDETLGKS